MKLICDDVDHLVDEKLFTTYEVPEELKSKLLLPLLTPRANVVLSGLGLDQMHNYVELKEFLLKQFRLTSRELKARFNTASRNNDESFALFNALLQSLFKYYVKSRGAEDDYKSLFDVMVSDRLKVCLPAGALTYVLSREGDECYSFEKIAELADIHVNNFQEGKYKGNAVTNFDMGKQMSKFKPRLTSSWQGKNAEHAGQGKKAVPIAAEVAKAYGPIRRCFNCNSPKCIARDCPEKKNVSKKNLVQ